MTKEIHIKKSVILEMLQRANPFAVAFTDNTNNKEYTVRELVKEVENETRIGIAYAAILEEMYNPQNSKTEN